MKRLTLLLCLCFLALVSGCGKRGRVIPRSEFIEINAEMLLADAWLAGHPEAKAIADTSAFYEPIFKRHGYTTLDYDASVWKYLRNPQKFAKMMSEVQDNIRLEQNVLKRLKKKSDEAKAINEMIFGYKPKEFELGGVDAIWLDTLSVSNDTISNISVICPTQKDTVIPPVTENSKTNSLKLLKAPQTLPEETYF